MGLLSRGHFTSSFQTTITGGTFPSMIPREIGLMRNLYLDDGRNTSRKSGVPNGYNMDAALLQPMQAGGLSSYNQARPVLSVVNSQAFMGRNLDGSSSASITVTTADLDQIVALIASGSIVLSAGTVSLSAGVSLSASASLVLSALSAQLGGIVPVTASANVVLTPDVVMTALANLEASAGGAGPLSPEGLAASLLDENDIENGYSMREALRLILASVAGKLSGAGTSTITIRAVTDDKNRIVATVDSNGNRSSLTYDVGD